jgi:hypothetical protein
MQHPNDHEHALARLQTDWPLSQIWSVPRYAGGTIWCARRRDDHKRALNAGSPEHLAEALEDEACR